MIKHHETIIRLETDVRTTRDERAWLFTLYNAISDRRELSKTQVERLAKLAEAVDGR